MSMLQYCTLLPRISSPAGMGLPQKASFCWHPVPRTRHLCPWLLPADPWWQSAGLSAALHSAQRLVATWTRTGKISEEKSNISEKQIFWHPAKNVLCTSLMQRQPTKETGVVAAFFFFLLLFTSCAWIGFNIWWHTPVSITTWLSIWSLDTGFMQQLQTTGIAYVASSLDPQ